MAMRVVGGMRRGTALVAPAGEATRPTTDRVRETLFNIIMHRDPKHIVDARVLDLFAGSGALGVEALSRGAAFALFVDEAGPARAAIRRNVEAIDAVGVSRIWRRSAVRLGDCPVAAFDTVFLDPPYGKGFGERALAAAADGQWLKPGALAVLEEADASAPDRILGFERVDARKIGKTALTFWVFSPSAGSG